MATISKAQKGKVLSKKKESHPNDDYKNMVNPETGKKGQMGGEGTTPPFGGPGPKKGTKIYDIGTRKYEIVKKNGGAVKKYKTGGSLSGLKASTKRAGSVDPKGAYTKVQKKALAGAKGKASLTKDKQLGATKMKAGGKMTKGKKC